MILVTLNIANFEYDIHSLVKAFFPKEDVSVTAETKVLSEAPLFSMAICYELGAGFTGADEQAVDSVPHTGEVQEPDVVFRDGEVQEPDAISFAIDGRGLMRIPVNYADRTQTKNRLKQALYRLLCDYTHTTLPWGTLTGIRPTKIPMAFLEEGRDAGWIRDYMKNTYFASDEKIDLSIEIAGRELALLRQADYRNGYSLYIGIPFCPSTCLYCSFTSYPLGKWAARMEEYLAALEKEIDFTARALRERKLNTVYIGGGTPTTLTAEQLDWLLTKVERSFDFSHLLEYTVEAGRPDSITAEKLQVLRKHHISRISINPQTMKQATLDLIGRRHTVEQTVESFHLARSLGFDNINMDLIVGLPEETIEDVQNTMERLKELNPDSITVHSLAIKRAARLRMFKEEYQDLTITNTWEIIDLTARYAREMGMLPYYLYRQKNMAGNFENVGYAKEGKAGLYNILIMEEKQSILALGAGATTKFVFDGGRRIERTDNVKDIENYLGRIDEMIERKREAIEKYM